ncbi:hypothetical protein [Psychroserpens sp. MEBiC05023]
MRLKKYDKVLLFFFVAAIAASSLIWLFEERFNASRWHSEPTLRYKMVDDIIDNELLIGLTQDEVFSLLGQPEFFNETSENQITYYLGKAPSFNRDLTNQLVIIFKDERVDKVFHLKE